MNTSFKSGINITAGISQKLTPQMQQAIRLLAMSSIELEQAVQQQLDSNPLLEKEEDSQDLLDKLNEADTLPVDDDVKQLASTDTAIDDYDVMEYADEQKDSFERLANSSLDDRAIDTDWSNIYTNQSGSTIRTDATEFESYQGNTSTSIQDHVRWQLNLKHLSQIDMMIADYLIDAMNDAGIIDIDIDDLQQNLTGLVAVCGLAEEVTMDEIEMVFHVIQSCEPVGVGAKNLAECLRLQLTSLPQNTPNIEHAYQLLAHSQYLLTNNIEALISETELNKADIKPALSLIRTLNFAPGRAYTNAQANYGLMPESYDIPDVLVDWTEDGCVKNMPKADKPIADKNEAQWHIRLNPETLPKLRINQEYASLVQRGVDTPDNNYLKNNLNDARMFMRSIEERNINLLKVATCIVKKQTEFLQHGAIAMKPLVLKEVADEIGLHESTVSRLTTNKTMLTPQGLFALKYFFSSSVTGNAGEQSSTAICAMIKQMVATEEATNPLTDSDIVGKLAEKGVQVARRTVAKYREQLNIASSIQRKQKYW